MRVPSPSALSLGCALVLSSLASLPANAGYTLTGDRLAVTFSDAGTWNDNTLRAGLAYFGPSGAWVDFTFAGIPYQLLSFSFGLDSETVEAYTVSGYEPASTFTTLLNADESTGTTLLAHWMGVQGPLLVERLDSWETDSSTLIVTVRVENTGTVAFSDFRFLFALDPDPDWASGNYETYNNARNFDGSGGDEWVESAGTSSGLTIGLGACEGESTEVGHYSSWSAATSANTVLYDMGFASGDLAMGLRYLADGDIEPGQAIITSLVVSVADTNKEAQAAYSKGISGCLSCDTDADGYIAVGCGGDDCDDLRGSIHPDGYEVYYNGIDENCDGLSDYDQDQDGFDALEYKGTDCDDLDAEISPVAKEVWYDGIDQDCDGNDADRDGDGYDSTEQGGDDCDDDDAWIGPGADEVWYDGVDQDCDGNDLDQDADGHDALAAGGDDCDDADPAIWEDCDHDGIPDADQDSGLEWGMIPGKGHCGCATSRGGLVTWTAWAVFALGLFRRRRPSAGSRRP